MKYIITGTQSTGKSVLLHQFEDKMDVVTEVVRNLFKDSNIKVNESGDETGQDMIFNTYKKIFTEKEGPFISDRGLTDVISYTCYLMKTGRVREEFLQQQVNEFIDFQDKNEDIVYFYVPIEFDVVDDGFRSLDEEFRREIDKNIKDFLVGFNVDFIEVRGTVEERTAIIENVMRSYGDIE